LTKAVDPLAGSFYVEALTDRIEKEAREIVEEVDRQGGAVAAINRGYFQEAIAESAWRQQQAQESGEQTVVGVNRFTDGSPIPAIPRPDFSALAVSQKARLAKVKAKRGGAEVAERLAALTATAKGTDSLVPPIIAAVRARVTLGEISDALRSAWGTYRPGG
ncbi:MAG TPA: methylmalonyl-CoA mutase family protein, partial [Gemmatimonadales bacterium]|nr:methylmalonyl-CoA mutase family protein [Gemmatimonadales bacterium]